jgi:hypothetical protein
MEKKTKKFKRQKLMRERVTNNFLLFSKIKAEPKIHVYFLFRVKLGFQQFFFVNILCAISYRVDLMTYFGSLDHKKKKNMNI